MTIKQLATHVAEIPSWFDMVLNTAELDFANNDYKPADITTHDKLMDHFEGSLADGKAVLAKGKGKQLEDFWTMRSGEQIHITSPKDEVMRQVFCPVVTTGPSQAFTRDC